MSTDADTDSGSGKTCPYCGIAFCLDGVNACNSILNFNQFRPGMGSPLKVHSGPPTPYTTFTLTSHHCPSCKGKIIWLNEVENQSIGEQRFCNVKSTTLLWPKNPVSRVPPGVPELLARDFREAHDTLPISPRASAALSRRCLQALIQDREDIHDRNLVDQIRKLLALNKLPVYLAADLDAIRNIGNFAAHPQKDRNTGEIVDVEPGEAEWILHVLEDILAFYFVELPKSLARRSALNQKLSDAGHKPMLGGGP